MPVFGSLPRSVGCPGAFAVEVWEVEVSPGWGGSVAKFFPCKLEVSLLEKRNVFRCDLFAFSDDDSTCDCCGSVIVDEWERSDGGNVLHHCEAVEPPGRGLRRTEIVLINIIHAMRGDEIDETLKKEKAGFGGSAWVAFLGMVFLPSGLF